MKIIILFSLLAVVLGQKSPYYSYDPEDIRQGFIAVDLNGNGIFTHDEMLEILRKDDINGDGFVSFAEYKLFKPIKTPKRVVRGEFQYYDKLDGENDGRISLSIAGRLINILDSNKDGRVTLAEFLENIPHVLNDMTREIDALVLVG